MAKDQSASYTRIEACRVCGGALSLVFCDLDAQPLANSYIDPARADAPEPRIPLRAVVCEECRLVQLDCLAQAHEIFSDYAYLSSVSASWVEHARAFCDAMTARRKPDFVVELASNDGYLLQHFNAAGVRALGVEPAANVAALARQKGVDTLVRFFGRAAAQDILRDHGAADLIVANNVLAHVPDVNDFVAGMAILLAPDGRISIECPHLVSMVEHAQFDTIYHEHYAYWSLLAMERLLARHGLAAVDVETLPTHGGSLRVFAAHADRAESSGALEAMRAKEAALGLDGDAYYRGFERRVSRIVADVEIFLHDCQNEGLRVAGYGAAAKGNTFLNRLGAAASVVECVADANPLKQGKLLPGTRIPIVSPEELAARAPDVILALPWNLAGEIAVALERLGLSGRGMATAIPDLRIVRIGE